MAPDFYLRTGRAYGSLWESHMDRCSPGSAASLSWILHRAAWLIPAPSLVPIRSVCIVLS